MFIICSEVKVQKHEHHYNYGRRKMSKGQSLNSIVLENKEDPSFKKQKLSLIAAKLKNSESKKADQQSQTKQKMKTSTRDIKDKCVKGMSKTSSCNTASFKNSLNTTLDFTKKVSSWQANILNTQGTEFDTKNKIRQEEEISYRTSNRVSKESEGSNHDTLITFKAPSLYDKIKHKRLSSHNVHTVISQQCLQEMGDVIKDKQYVIEQSVIYDHNVTSKFTQITPTIKFKKYEQFLAEDNQEKVVISVRSVPLESSGMIVSKQLQNYQKFDTHPNILTFYQVNLHYQSQLLIKQPYTSVIGNKKLTETQIENILLDIGEGLNYLKTQQIYMDWITIEDIRQVAGVYKLADLSRSFHEERIQIHHNLLNLRNLLFDSCYY